MLQPSVVYLCPVCGETWARIIVPGQPFFAAHVACKNHRAHALEVPGSIWDPDIGDYPLPVLQRELALALAQFDREQIQTA